jgi:hypothetical protein
LFDKKSTKRTQQACRLTAGSNFKVSEIGSPHGFFANKIRKALRRRRLRDITAEQPPNENQHLRFMYDGALAPFDTRFFH